ncbi:MAG: helix-turn-helix transcriptional regulator [Lachnospiraceae bacterium]|nr:helix-turn-helix transcriptional regulator [Lachnospiraceae bacterium]
MFPTINLRETGVNLRRIMDRRGVTVKDVAKYLGLSSLQSVYHWLNGLTMPTIDNLYALSELLQVPIDDIVCGNRKAILPEHAVITGNPQARRLYEYYIKLNKMLAA